ncbi:GntR family transcriptional regulator [Ponticoccus alexandrii]|uniref:FCD domain-containing protein n=1 Tax=Ponticoccus alexandrii TaxID=1943633 RepID=A0ABX7FEQ3_9RHOB|nr:GntR family transcriptional regulator [Ponticoccus alexandrii]QRF68606.1 FCD domain-containing protein [Ponticoccus alexandrii]
MPVREAVRRLVAEKAITQSSNRAFTVPLLSPDELNELVELRLYLETFAARSACGRIDADSLRSLMALNGRMRAQLEEHDKRGALQSNQAFHFTLYRAGASTVLMDMIELLWLRCGPYLAAALFAFSGGERHFGVATELHEEIIRGLLNENADRVSRALTADLQKTADWYRTQSSGAVGAALAGD